MNHKVTQAEVGQARTLVFNTERETAGAGTLSSGWIGGARESAIALACASSNSRSFFSFSARARAEWAAEEP